MRKSLALVTAAILLCSCGANSDNENKDSSLTSQQQNTEGSVSDTSDAEEEVQTEFIVPVRSDDGTEFDKYPSNTYISTGNNGWVSCESVTFRAYLPAEAYGNLEYCFYISNAIDSTYGDGNPINPTEKTGDYTIESAYIADGGTSTEDEITGRTQVTFDGKESKDVTQGEAFWSDPVEFDLPDGHFIVWEWTLTGKHIPAINMSNLTCTQQSEDGEEFSYCGTIPLPQIFGAKRDVKLDIAAIGDSITQGCETEYMAYESWAMQLPQKLGADYSFANFGIGYSRASDAAMGGDWLARASHADITFAAFGTNDIVSGEYGGDGGNTAEEVLTYVKDVVQPLVNSGSTVIVFNAPPFDYKEDREKERCEYNEMLKKECAEMGAYYFDFASYLEDPQEPSHALYGAHPKGEAGGILSDALIEYMGL